MTINTTASETYEQRLDHAAEAANNPEPGDNATSPASAPKLFWAGAALFAMNVLVLGGIATSPELRVSVYGEVRPGYMSVDKPSPFTEVVDTAKPRKVKLAQRVTPILQYPEPTMADLSLAPTELAVPRASQVAAATLVSTAPASTTLRGDAAYRAADSYGEFRRVTAVSRELVPPTPRRVTN